MKKEICPMTTMPTAKRPRGRCRARATEWVTGSGLISTFVCRKHATILVRDAFCQRGRVAPETFAALQVANAAVRDRYRPLQHGRWRVTINGQIPPGVHPNAAWSARERVAGQDAGDRRDRIISDLRRAVDAAAQYLVSKERDHGQ